MMPQEIQQRILLAIQARAPAMSGCPVCRVGRWTLIDGIVKLPVITDPKQFPNVVLGGATLPTVALVCNNCGNTIFMNLMVLGLTDLTEAKASPAEQSTAASDSSSAEGS
jgi:hypothetical protein